MFSRTDGPTALQANLVRALSFTCRQVDIDTPDGPEAALAALASVWNGKKGFVAVIVRNMKRQVVERFVFSGSITTESAFESATAEGIEFAENLGFEMDSPEFCRLPAEAQVKRLKSWNKLRKVRKPKAARLASPDANPALVEQSGPGGEPAGKAVLGKIALERRRGSGPWPNPLERLLPYF